MNKLFVYLIIGLFLISFTSALDSLGTFKQDETVRITQVCSDATYINISSVSYPNSTTAISNIQMTSAGSGEFYYDFTQTSTLGRYDVRGISDGCDNTFATYFEITPTGTILDPSEATLYFMLTIAVFILFLMCLYAVIMIPYSNAVNTSGDILQITKLKYVKIFMILPTHGLLVWFLNLMIGISDNYLTLPMYYGFFSFAFNLLNIMAYPLFVIIFVWALWGFFNDLAIDKQIQKFGSYRT